MKNTNTDSLFAGHVDGGMYDGCPCRACAWGRHLAGERMPVAGNIVRFLVDGVERTGYVTGVHPHGTAENRLPRVRVCTKPGAYYWADSYTIV
jgi:hypothetical protein